MPRKKKIEDAEVVEAFIAHSQTADNTAEAVRLTLCDLEISKRRFLEIIQRHKAIEAGKEIARQVKEEIYQDKLPIIKSIVGLSLQTIHDFVADLKDDPIRKALLTVQEVKDLVTVATELNGLVRLEEGKATHKIGIEGTVEVNHNYTIEALQKLKQLDPIMEYPEIQAIETQFEYVESK